MTPHCVAVPVCVPVPRTACHTVARWWWSLAEPMKTFEMRKSPVLFIPWTAFVLFVTNHKNYRSTKSQTLCAGQFLSKCVSQSQWQSATLWPGRFQERWVYPNHIKLLLERVFFCWRLTLESCQKPKSQILPIFILVFPKVCAPAPVVAHPHHHHAHHTKAVHGK